MWFHAHYFIPIFSGGESCLGVWNVARTTEDIWVRTFTFYLIKWKWKQSCVARGYGTGQRSSKAPTFSLTPCPCAYLLPHLMPGWSRRGSLCLLCVEVTPHSTVGLDSQEMNSYLLLFFWATLFTIRSWSYFIPKKKKKKISILI